MRRSMQILIVVLTVTTTAAAADEKRLDDPRSCSAWLATPESSNGGYAAKRACLIAVASTYLDALLVEGAPGVLLWPDVKRWIGRNYDTEPPLNDGIEELLPRIERENLGAEHMSFVRRRWTVDVGRNEAIVILNIVGPELAEPVIVRERFLIVDGRIREIEAHVYNRPEPTS